ncbi:histidine phosphatase family protein [Anaerotalea alkaliphila]|uniref:Histidine phosphatase family protein n=1 Tax=Anaerotalea alkaliphila TaxID=2662126 RepID=A0A7X5HXB8_9FIRM|nr:histidine phosphatase family protein [Anaerotalea alkaliphila]NDL68350.1 histidine phosphatase family protein [Anaerotalea alkaliphila]
MKKIHLIRHAKTKGNLAKRYIGRTDESLSAEGIALLKERADQYPRVALVFTSPLKRCVETADILYGDAPRVQMEDLRECDFGIFENKTYEELKDRSDYQNWIDSGGKGEIPQGESGRQFRTRCTAAFDEILEHIHTHEVDCAAVVVHGGTIMAILEAYAPERKDFYDWQIENGGMLTITIRNRKIEKICR